MRKTKQTFIYLRNKRSLIHNYVRNASVITQTNLFHVAVKTEEVEEAVTVHLVWMEAAHHGNRARSHKGGRKGGGEGLWDELFVGDQFLYWLMGSSVSAVRRQGQQGTRWACADTHMNEQTYSYSGSSHK